MGWRLLSSDIEVTLQGVARDDRSIDAGDTWVDPLLALRASANLGERWQAAVLFDAGGFGLNETSERTWQVVVALTYRLSDSWSASLGYRHLYADQISAEVPYELELSGPLLGIGYRF